MTFRKKDNARTARMQIRLLPEEVAMIEEQARKAGLSTSEFVRTCALSRRIAVRYDTEAVDAVTELAETVGQLRDAVVGGGHPFDLEAFRALGATCIQALERMVWA
jgi:hypothetical protein